MSVVRRQSRVDVVMGCLAGGIYRPWFWANFKGKQDGLRRDWAMALGGTPFTRADVREGMARWEREFGVDVPPTPVDFVSFLRPNHSDVSRSCLSGLKDNLGI